MTSYEYFCKECGQLRLCFDPDLEGCGNCGGKDIIKGKLLTLDKIKLKREFKGKEKDNAK